MLVVMRLRYIMNKTNIF